MTSDREDRWAPSRRAGYLQAKAAEAEQREARAAGQAAARDLDRIWRDLSGEELGLLDFLLSGEAPESFIADYDEPVFRSLAERGLLQRPRGVGGNWMRAPRTSFQVAPAVREKILAAAENYFGIESAVRSRRRGIARAFLKSKAVF